VDEVNAASADSPWKGAVWSFTTADFLVVDDFESYTDEDVGRIFQTWIDGWGYTTPPPGNPGNGVSTLSLQVRGYPEVNNVSVTETGGKMTLTGDGNGASMQYRATTSGASGNYDATAVIAPPYWVKLERIGESSDRRDTARGSAVALAP
jgi:hypothetical protein